MCHSRLIVLGILVMIFIVPNLSFAWWSSSWLYRIPINITEQSGSTLTDYQVKVVVDTATLISEGKMNSDCSDMRFVDSDDVTSLSYWIESGCNTANTIVWVKVPSIPASSNKTIYMYYGNPTATSESNGTAVFDFFDDFSIDTTAQYTETADSGSGYFSWDSTNLRLKGYSSTAGVQAHYTHNTFVFSDGIIEVKTITGSDGGFTFRFQDQSNLYLIAVKDDTNSVAPQVIQVWKRVAGTWTKIGVDYSITNPAGSEHTLKFKVQGTLLTIWWDGNLVVQNLDLGTDFSSGKIGARFNRGTAYWDDIIVRKYTSPEPTTSVGAEESTNQAPQITIYSPENKTYYTTNIPLNITVLDEDSTSFWCAIYDDGSMLINLTTNTTYITTLSKIAGSHNVSVSCEDSDGGTSYDDVLYYVWMGLNISVFDASTGTAMSDWNITITNGTSTYTAQNLSNPTLFEWNTIPYGEINITIDDGSSTKYYFQNLTTLINNETNYHELLINLTPKSANEVTITSSAGFSLTEGDITTISCTTLEGTPTLTMDNIVVSNPYTFQPTIGVHTIFCYVGETENYAPNNKTESLTVNPAVSCTNNNTFAFRKTLTVSGIITLNMTAVVNSHLLKDDLSDIKVTGSNGTWINTTNGYYLILNGTGQTITVEFGNYFANISYPTRSIENVQDIGTYEQINPYVLYNIRDELTGELFFPPNATVTSIIQCSYGETYIPISDGDTEFIIASRDYITKASLRVTYTADAYYSRQIYPEQANSLVLNFYVVDAYKHALDRIDFKMQDVNYYNSKLQIYKTISNQIMLITEGNFDASHYFSAYLLEDSDYYLRTVSPDGTITEFGRITIVAPTEKVLGQAKMSLSPQAVLIADNILMNAWTDEARNTLYVVYSDATNSTEKLNITIYFENGTIFRRETYDNTSSVSLNYNISNYSDENFVVEFSVEHSMFGNSPVVYNVGVFTPFMWDLGISTLWYQLIALGIVVLIGGLTTRRSLIGGTILLFISVVVIYQVGWLNIPKVTFAFMAVLSVIAIAVYFKQGGE